MSSLPTGFVTLYTTVLEQHLKRSNETARHQAYELGRQALMEGAGVLDIVQLHHDALSCFLFDHAGGSSDTLEHAAEFLADCLSPYEMSLRGYQEANHRLNNAHDALTRAHEQLQAEMDERRKAEEALVHAKKLQAIGLLAGGVAHHFNNLLTVVLGNIDLVRRRLGKEDEKSERLLAAASRGAERGAEVTRQLLSFSRQQYLKSRVIHLAEWLEEVGPLLSASLRGDIVIARDVAPDVKPIEVDTSQLELALLNLAVNARDAMPAGGTLTLSAANRTIRDGRHGLQGEYVAVEMRDTGQGVPADLLSRVFEPFFSTKDAASGSGLGLSQVHGFTHQSGGAVEIESEPGEGTIVRLYLPAAKAVAEEEQAAMPRSAASKSSSGRILVVEDDADVAAVACDLLEELGYSVRLTERAQEALDVIDSGEPVDLLFSDVVMPGGLNGIELAAAVHHRFPALPILLTSGYNDAMEAVEENGLKLIAKPFQVDELQKQIGTLLRSRTAH